MQLVEPSFLMKQRWQAILLPQLFIYYIINKLIKCWLRESHKIWRYCRKSVRSFSFLRMWYCDDIFPLNLPSLITLRAREHLLTLLRRERCKFSETWAEWNHTSDKVKRWQGRWFLALWKSLERSMSINGQNASSIIREFRENCSYHRIITVRRL